MTEALLPRSGALLRMGLLVAIATVAIAIEAAPTGLHPRALPSPDLVSLAVAIMAVRRPDAVPIPLIFAIGLARDLLTDMPVGLGTLGLVLMAEVLRAVSASLARASLVREWLLLAALLLGVMVAQCLLMMLTFAQPPYLLTLARQWALTMVTWPFLLIVMRWGLGIRAEPVAASVSREGGRRGA